MCFQSCWYLQLKKHIKECVFSILFMLLVETSYKRLCVFNICYVFGWKIIWKIVCFQCFWDVNPTRQKSVRLFIFFCANWVDIPKTLKIHSLLYCFSSKNIKTIEPHTQSFIWVSNQKYKKNWNTQSFIWFFKNIQIIETHTQYFIWASNQKYKNDWKHIVALMFFRNP